MRVGIAVTIISTGHRKSNMRIPGAAERPRRRRQVDIVDA